MDVVAGVIFYIIVCIVIGIVVGRRLTARIMTTGGKPPKLFTDLKITGINEVHLRDDGTSYATINLANSDLGSCEESAWIELFDKVCEAESAEGKVYAWRWEGVSLHVHMPMSEIKERVDWLNGLIAKTNLLYRERLDAKQQQQARQRQLQKEADAIDFGNDVAH